jgi:hypothetical protein
MSANPQTIWSVPAYLPYVQPAVTESLIRDAEKKIGFKLPSDYIALLKTQNGGYIRYGLPDSVHSMIYGIGPDFPSITDFDWEDARECVSMELDGLVPFDGDGHWHLCIDYRNDPSAPCVSYVDVECDSESKIADSFGDYLGLLRLTVGEHEFVIPSVSDIEAVKSRVASLLGVEFEAPNSYDQGYPIHRGRCGTAKDPQWIWLSPNLVPRGFVREEDRRYKELSGLLPGEAMRFPELGKSSYLLTVTDGIRSRVLKAFRDASIELRPLAEFVT